MPLSFAAKIKLSHGDMLEVGCRDDYKLINDTDCFKLIKLIILICVYKSKNVLQLWSRKYS